MLSVDAEMGGFRNWAAGSPWENWRTSRPSNLTPEQREEILKVGREATAKRLADEKALREHARLMAGAMWGRAEESGHAYLDRKGICSNGSRVLEQLLLVPLCDWGGALHTLQTILADGTKMFLRGGDTKGRFHWIRIGHQEGPVVYVCEGFATGSTIHAATGGKPVVVAFNCGNLWPVCEVIRYHLPKARIVVCADDDRKTPGNPGLTKATEAAKSIRGRMAVPVGMVGTDFNDLQQEKGIAEVRRQLLTTKVPLTLIPAEV
jgi:Uncharacterized protein conserved in bacteria